MSQAGHRADDEANVLRRMSLRPLNGELSRGSSRLFRAGRANRSNRQLLWKIWTLWPEHQKVFGLCLRVVVGCLFMHLHEVTAYLSV